MLHETLDLAAFAVLLALLSAALIGVLWTWLWALRRLWLGIPLIDEAKPASGRRVRWGATTLALVVVLYFFVSVVVVRVYAGVSGRHMPREDRAVAKAAPPGAATPIDAAAKVGADTAKPPAGAKPEAEPKLQSQGELMLQSAIINVLLLFLAPALVMKVSGATPADLGWDPSGWQPQLFRGMRAALLMTPVVFAIQSLAARIWPPQKHPLEEMVLQQFTPGVAVLAIVSAVVLAPLVEELLFRGLLQPWLAGWFQGRWAHDPDEVNPLEWPDSESLEEGGAWGGGADEAPMFRGSDLATPLRTEPRIVPVVNAIFVTSAVFAVMHWAQWPAPIAIFILSLWLGTIYHRTGSLISAIALHGTFNSFSTLMLLLEALGRKLAVNAPAGILAAIQNFMN